MVDTDHIPTDLENGSVWDGFHWLFTLLDSPRPEAGLGRGLYKPFALPKLLFKMLEVRG